MARTILTALAVVLGLSATANANDQAQRTKDLPGTVVIRIDERTGEATVSHLSAVLEDNEANKAAVAGTQFRALPTPGEEELNRDTSRSSWFVHYGRRGHHHGSYPVYGHSGYAGYGSVYPPIYTPTFVSYGYVVPFVGYCNYVWGGFRYLWYRWY